MSKPEQYLIQMNVHPTAELDQFVQTRLNSGPYNSASEVVGEGLRMMEQKDESRSIQLQEVRNHMDRALGESDRGEGTDGDQFMLEILDDLDGNHARKCCGSWSAANLPL